MYTTGRFGVVIEDEWYAVDTDLRIKVKK